MHLPSRARGALLSGLLPALLLALSACGPTGGGGGGVTLEQLGPAYAESLCELYSRCDPIVVSLFVGGEANCVANAEASFEDQQLPLLQAAVAAGTLVYDGAQASACVAAVCTASCTSNLDAPAACEGTFVGQVAVGGSCMINEECAGDAYCENFDACPGSCVALVPVGGDCSGTGLCTSGSSCNESGVCEADAPIGGACMFDSDCSGISVCAGADPELGTAGTCTARASLYTSTLGESCDVETAPCVTGLSCIVESIGPMGPTYICAEPVGAGEACTVGAPSQCPETQYCNANVSAGMTTGTCVNKPGAGQACGMTAFGGTCAAGLTCNEANVCQAAARLGDPCSTDGDCASGTCASGVCAAPECG